MFLNRFFGLGSFKKPLLISLASILPKLLENALFSCVVSKIGLFSETFLNPEALLKAELFFFWITPAYPSLLKNTGA